MTGKCKDVSESHGVEATRIAVEIYNLRSSRDDIDAKIDSLEHRMNEIKLIQKVCQEVSDYQDEGDEQTPVENV